MKLDNARAARGAKVELRRHVLREVQRASVFDAFCGLGAMREAVWQDAAAYVGCDVKPWSLDQAPRFVADNRLVLRTVDLLDFNVFDFDAYGSPWEQMAILVARRPWANGERGAVVLTDGSSMKLRFGGMPHAMTWILGDRAPKKIIPSVASAHAVQERVLTAWTERSHVHVVRRWRAEGNGSGRGGQKMIYSALVFEGRSSS